MGSMSVRLVGKADGTPHSGTLDARMGRQMMGSARSASDVIVSWASALMGGGGS